MKKFIIIYDAKHHIIYEGNPLNLPIKRHKIQEKSMEVFRDPDPCIIHQSYVIQSFVELLIGDLPIDQEISFKELSIDTEWLDMKDILSCSIKVKR
ncbi:MAG: hypothetical protein RBR75_06820 [Acholeplasmataceae bacterium]|jgi:hypothetical protein|nr:hypothetical protein [Acholeplasmataceae bacterium]